MSTTTARQPLKMAMNTRRLTTVLTVSPPNSVRMYDMGVSAPMSADSDGAPRMAAVTGMSAPQRDPQRPEDRAGDRLASPLGLLREDDRGAVTVEREHRDRHRRKDDAANATATDVSPSNVCGENSTLTD